MEEMLKRILAELSDIRENMATRQMIDEVNREISELKLEVNREISELKLEVNRDITELRLEMNRCIAELKSLMEAYHEENIAADEKLLEGLRMTNDRLDFQRDRLAKVEEEVFLLKARQS